jgi:hypothetical protein
MTGFDPIEMLRRADPLDPLEVPTDTTGAHARALFQEVTSMDAIEQETRPVRKQPLKRKLALGVAMAVVATAVAGGAYALLRDKAEAVIVGGEPIGGGMASCIRYSDDLLLENQFAFDGTLVSGNEDGTQATFEVHQWYRGGEGDTVTLNAEGMLGYGPIALIGLSLLENQRYLISGNDGHVNACGFSVTYDTALAGHWAELFGA